MNTDQWTKDDRAILSAETLSKLQRIIEDESALVVEHRFYRGARAPYRFVSDDFEMLRRYLQEKTTVGDSIYFWRFDTCCRDENVAVTSKVPDKFGKVPIGGAY